MFINKENGSSYSFEAPNIPGDTNKKVKAIFPTAEAVSPTVSANAASVAINRERTIVKLGSLSAATTLTLAPVAANLNVGAVVIVSWTSDSTARNITVKIGKDTVATLAGTASTKVSKQLMWDGETFLAI